MPFSAFWGTCGSPIEMGIHRKFDGMIFLSNKMPNLRGDLMIYWEKMSNWSAKESWKPLFFLKHESNCCFPQLFQTFHSNFVFLNVCSLLFHRYITRTSLFDTGASEPQFAWSLCKDNVSANVSEDESDGLTVTVTATTSTTFTLTLEDEEGCRLCRFFADFFFQRKNNKKLGGGLKYFLFSPLFGGRWTHFD